MSTERAMLNKQDGPATRRLRWEILGDEAIAGTIWDRCALMLSRQPVVVEILIRSPFADGVANYVDFSLSCFVITLSMTGRSPLRT